MKKKEILTIFVLAVLAMGGSWFCASHSEGCWSYGYPLKFLHKCFVGPLILEPLTIPSREVRWSLTSLAADLLFWLLAWGIIWWGARKFLRLEKAKLVIRGLILIGGLISISSFFLPWSDAPGSIPFLQYRNFFKNSHWSMIAINLFVQPQLILGIIVILGVYSKFRKGTYWICLVASIWSLLLNFYFGTLALLYNVSFGIGTYAARIGPIITLIGLIFYKLVSRKERLSTSGGE